MYRNLTLLIFTLLVSVGLKAQQTSYKIELDGAEWWNSFQENHKAVLHNAPYSLQDNKAQFLWRKQGLGNGSLLFDGYSTYLEIEDAYLEEEFAVSFWIAPRAFDSAIDDKLASVVDFYHPEDSTSFRIGLLKHGQLAVEYSDGKNPTVFKSEHAYVLKNRWNHVRVIHEDEELIVKINGDLVIQKNLDDNVYSDFFEKKMNLMIGRNSSASGFGDKFKFNMISGLLDEILIHNTKSQIEENYYSERSGILEKQDLESALRLDFTKYGNENFKPSYHATAPAHWMNEPHAPLFYNGKYHLFYQHNPFGPYWGQIHWGHWVSDDMVHWKHADIALAPEKGDIDPDGIWSGSAFIGPNNTPMLFYTAGNLSKDENQYTSIAIPADTTDPYLKEWKKTGVIVEKPSEYKKNEFRDPFVFKIEDNYYMIVGSGIEGRGGSAPLFQSKDAINWQYLHPFYISDKEKYPILGGVWELPVFLPLTKEDGTPTNKYVFMVLPLRDEADVEVFYWIGEFDKKTKKFVPDDSDPKLMDYGDFGFTGPSGMVDPKTGRSIVFSIAQGKYGNIDTYDMGWAHNAGLPVSLWLNDADELRFSPIKELESLRKEELISCQNCNTASIDQQLKELHGEKNEIIMEFSISDLKAGIEVRRSEDGSHKAMIYYDPESDAIVFDKKQENPERDFRALKAPLNGVKNVKLHIYLDRSMIEIYINNTASITDRIYFKDKDATGFGFIGAKTLDLSNFQIWSLNGIDWEYTD